MHKIDFPKLIAAIAVCFIASIIGHFFTVGSLGNWYAALEKPFFTPPGWVFGVAWFAIYAMMGMAAYLVWERAYENKEAKFALALFGILLGLNIGWSFIFFTMHNIFLALIELIILWIAIAGTIIKFKEISVKASVLMLPYFIWVGFAVLLNYFMWIMN